MEKDRIEKQVLLHAPIDRVWRAISDSKEFGRWFGIDFDGPFVAGKPLTAIIVTTTVDAEVAKQQKPYEGMRFEIQVEKVEPMCRLSFRWHPYSAEADVSQEPMTLVQLDLQQVHGETRLTVTESGFERLSEARRAEAYPANEGGWAMQMELIKKYMARASAERPPYAA